MAPASSCATPGRASTIRPRSTLASSYNVTGVSATIVAVLGVSVKTPISPKWSPGPRQHLDVDITVLARERQYAAADDEQRLRQHTGFQQPFARIISVALQFGSDGSALSR